MRADFYSKKLFLLSFFTLTGVALATDKANKAPKEKIDPVAMVKDRAFIIAGFNPDKIMSYKYKGKTVYLAVMPCCDQMNLLLDSKGIQICSPSGGFSGHGDGKCTDFEKKKSAEKVLFELKEEAPKK